MLELINSIYLFVKLTYMHMYKVYIGHIDCKHVDFDHRYVFLIDRIGCVENERIGTNFAYTVCRTITLV